MTDPPLISVSDLIGFSELLADSYHCGADHVFDSVGLILPKRGCESKFAEECAYDCTPINTVPFAHTGVDGTHFSLLRDANEDAGRHPVVMTRPMACGNESLIVGASIWEFLSLGYHIGYFDIESLHLGFPNNTNIQQAFAAAAGLPTSNYGSPPFYKDNPKASARLSDLRVRFQLSPWPDIHDHLKLLNNAHLPQLRFRVQSQEA
jgi:hypothetical protein